MVCFLLASGAWNAVEGVVCASGSSDGTPALRGLVHLGVAMLMAPLVASGAPSCTATPFAAIGLPLATFVVAQRASARAAWQCMAMAAMEVACEHAASVGAASALAALALVPLLSPATSPETGGSSVGADAGESIAAVFHAAFVAALGSVGAGGEDGSVDGLFSVACAVLSAASWRHGQGTELLLLAASAYGAVRAARKGVRGWGGAIERGGGRSEEEEGSEEGEGSEEEEGSEEGEARFEPEWVYHTACASYAAALAAEALLGRDTWRGEVEVQTALVHVSAILASLVGFVPTVATHSRLARAAVAAFPFADGALAAWRRTRLPPPPLTSSAALAAVSAHACLSLALCAALSALPLRRPSAAPLATEHHPHPSSSLPPPSPSPPPDARGGCCRATSPPTERWGGVARWGEGGAERADAGALAVYALSHAAFACSRATFGEALHVTFHNEVVTLGLSSSSFLTPDPVSRRISLVLCAMQAATSPFVAALMVMQSSAAAGGTPPPSTLPITSHPATWQALLGASSACVAWRLWRMPPPASPTRPEDRLPLLRLEWARN